MNKNNPVKLSDIKEFLPEGPVLFNPPKTMYVWDDDDANDPETSAPYLAEVLYVNPSLGVKRVFARGNGMAAQNAGATWDHCAETTGTGRLFAQAYIDGTLGSREQLDHHVIKIFNDDDVKINPSAGLATYRELSEWLSKGKGQVLMARQDDAINPPTITNTLAYPNHLDEKPVPYSLTAGTGEMYYKIRRYDDTEFVDPLRKNLEEPPCQAVLDSAVEVPESVKHNLGLQPGQCFHHLASTPDWSTVVDEGNHG